MSKTFCLPRGRSVGILLAAGLACVAAPAAASASAVNLGTAAPFAVLGGSTVTNTGPSVLNGNLGVAPGTSLTGFSLPAVVNGATHDDDAVARQAQTDLVTAYNTAAGQAVAPAAQLTGQDLGGMTLTPGAYKFSSSAQLTGRLTLNAEGNPNAQFVFEIGSTLTTASASSVELINGASPCNVYWQIGSSATLGSTTIFAGNLMAHTSITVNDGSTVQGRLLANVGAVTLDNDVVNASQCAPTSSTPPGTGPTPAPTPTPSGTQPPAGPPAGPPKSHRGWGKLGRSQPTPVVCSAGFTAIVRGREIKRVVFRIDGKWLATRTGPAFRVYVPPVFARNGVLGARVTFKDATAARTLTLHYRACAAAVAKPRPAPSTFTG